MIRYPLFLFLAILFSVTGYCSDLNETYTVFVENGKKGLVNQYGEVIIPAKYEEIGWSTSSSSFTGNVIGYRKKGEWGLISAQNKIITSPKYHSLDPSNGYIIASQKPRINSEIRYGVLNTKGKLVIPFIYYDIKIRGENVIAENKDNYGLFTINNKQLLPFIYQKIDSIAPNRFAVLDLKGKIGIVDQKGISLLKTNIDSISPLIKNHYYIYQEGKTGLLSKEGVVIHEPEFKSIKVEDYEVSTQSFNQFQIFKTYTESKLVEEFDEIKVVDDQTLIVSLNKKKRVKFNSSLSNPYQNIYPTQDGIFVVYNGNKYGVINQNFEVILSTKYDEIQYEKGLLYCKKLSEWSVFDTLGIKKSVFEYEKIGHYSEGLISVLRNGKWGFINRAGQEVIFPVFEFANEFNNGYATVQFHGEQGIIDKKGNWIIYPQEGKRIILIENDKYLIQSDTQSRLKSFDDALIYYSYNPLYFVSGLILERSNDGWKIINTNGVIIGRSLTKPAFLHDGETIMLSDSSSVSLINKNGKVYIPFGEYNEITSMSEGFMGVKKDDFYGFVDYNNKLRVANRYEGIGPFYEGVAPFKLRGKWGFINNREKIVIQPYYGSVSNFVNGICIAEKAGQYGILDKVGKEVQPFEFHSIEALSNGKYIARRKGKFGVINELGNLVIYPQYSEIKQAASSYFIVKKNGKYGVIKEDGSYFIDLEYDFVFYDQKSDQFIAKSNGGWN